MGQCAKSEDDADVGVDLPSKEDTVTQTTLGYDLDLLNLDLKVHDPPVLLELMEFEGTLGKEESLPVKKTRKDLQVLRIV